MPAESYDDDEEEQEGPKSSFGTYLAEGDALFKQSEFKKALESYSLALELQPEDKNCLVARSKCYLKLGDPQKALQDAEAALSEDKEFNRGLYRKAEALYCMGDFEYALMYYHRGHNLRPELDEFRLGIQKAQEAIDNSIGSAAKVKLENKGDLSFFNRQDDIGSKKRGYTKPTRNLKLKPVIVNRNKETKPPAPSKKTVKQLLGELYADKEYMEKLMNDEDFIQSHSNKPVYELVQSGLAYLDTRTEFWRQQRPLYARKKDTGRSSPKKKKGGKQSLGKHVLKQLEEIDQALATGDPERSLKLAQTLMKSVDDADPASLPNKGDVIANIHSCIGNAFVELENLNKALKHHQKDLEMSKKSKSQEGISRGLDNVGRVYARIGDYEKAVRSWNEKLPMVKTPLETTWIYHEIGRCYLELNKYQKAKDCGSKSLEAAKEFEDEVWQLNASVLIAQALVKLGDFSAGLKNFEDAHEIAVSLSDESAQDAISKAIADLQKKMEDGNGNTTTDHETSSNNASDSETDDNADYDPGVKSDDAKDEKSDEDEGDTTEKEEDTTDNEKTKSVTSDAEPTDEDETKYENDYEDDTKSDNESESGSKTGDDAPTDSLISPRDKTDTDDADTEQKTTTLLSDTEDDETTSKKVSDETSTDVDKSHQDTDQSATDDKTDTEPTDSKDTKTITEDGKKSDNDDNADDTLEDVTPQNSDNENDKELDENADQKPASPTPPKDDSNNAKTIEDAADTTQEKDEGNDKLSDKEPEGVDVQVDKEEEKTADEPSPKSEDDEVKGSTSPIIAESDTANEKDINDDDKNVENERKPSTEDETISQAAMETADSETRKDSNPTQDKEIVSDIKDDVISDKEDDGNEVNTDKEKEEEDGIDEKNEKNETDDDTQKPKTNENDDKVVGESDKASPKDEEVKEKNETSDKDENVEPNKSDKETPKEQNEQAKGDSTAS